MSDPDQQPRFASAFVLRRDRDLTGVSGTGLIADGVLFPDGHAAIHWRGRWPLTTPHPDGLASIIDIHDHGGRGDLRIEWAAENAAAQLAADARAVQALYEGFHAAICVREANNPVCQLVAPQFRDALRAGLLRAQHLGESR